jgi:hypothetical protein
MSNKIKNMKKLVLSVAFLLAAFVGYSQCKMDSDGRTLRNSSNSSIGRIDSDGVTIRNSSNSSVGRVDSDGVTIRNSSNSTVLKIDGNTIRNSSKQLDCNHERCFACLGRFFSQACPRRTLVVSLQKLIFVTV